MDVVGGIELTHTQIRKFLADNNWFAKRGIADWKKIDAKSKEYKAVVSEFQEFNGLPNDGKAGALTQFTMQLPRCGMPDYIMEAQAQPQWPTACLSIPTSHRLSTLVGLDAATIHAEWVGALNAVAQVCLLSPFFVDEEHDAKCFALPGPLPRATLAYAYLPNNDCADKLDSKYNTKVTWDVRQLRSTMRHEMCHWWGLGHGPPGSLMAPTDDPTQNGELDAWTINELVKRYGKRVTPPPTTPPVIDSITVACEVNGRKYAGAIQRVQI